MGRWPEVMVRGQVTPTKPSVLGEGVRTLFSGHWRNMDSLKEESLKQDMIRFVSQISLSLPGGGRLKEKMGGQRPRKRPGRNKVGEDRAGPR